MQADTAFVRPDRGIELYAIPTVDLNLAVVIHPRNTEKDLALRLYDSFHDPVGFQLGVGGYHRLQRTENFTHGLQKLFFAGVSGFYAGINFFQILRLKHEDSSYHFLLYKNTTKLTRRQ